MVPAKFPIKTTDVCIILQAGRQANIFVDISLAVVLKELQLIISEKVSSRMMINVVKCSHLCVYEPVHPLMSVLHVVQTPFTYIIFTLWNHTVLFLSPSKLSASGSAWRYKHCFSVFDIKWILDIYIHADIGGYHPFPQLHSLFLLSLIISTVLLISHTMVTEMEECILAIANHIDPLGHSPHPNLLTPDRK